MNTNGVTILAHLARAQFDTRFACEASRDPRLSDIEQACMDDVAGLYTQIEERYLAALTEIEDQARIPVRAVRSFSVVRAS